MDTKVHLTIDIGNTRAKLALHNIEAEATSQQSTDEPTLTPTQPAKFLKCSNDTIAQSLPEFISGHNVKAAIICSTAAPSTEVNQLLQKLGIHTVVNMDSHTPLPIRNCYDTPQTLGADRLAAAIGAYFEQKKNSGKKAPVMVIDAGTAITYDFVGEEGEFLGGNISPGINLRFLSLHEHTARLPLLNPSAVSTPPDHTFGHNTEEAILHGVIDGVRREIETTIDEFSKKNPSLSVFLTGGDMLNFSENIKSRIFADEFLVSKGLDIILTYNED